MKLNNDCVRDLMLYIEEHVDLYDSVSIKDIITNIITQQIGQPSQ